MKLAQKLVGAMLIVLAITVAAIGWSSVQRGRTALRQQQTESLEAIRISRRHSIEFYFEIIHKQILNLVHRNMAIEAVTEFRRTFAQAAEDVAASSTAADSNTATLESYYQEEFLERLPQDKSSPLAPSDTIPDSPSGRILQSMYIVQNPNPIGRRHKLNTTSTACEYNRIHERYHPQFQDFQSSFGYYDLLLFDLEGNIVYTVNKETDFGTNILTGPYSDSHLRAAFTRASKATSNEVTFIEDYAPYLPSYGAPGSFITAPIYKEETIVGVLALQLPVDRINRIMGNTAGLGDTGETYLIGNDLFMRSDSRFSPTPTILKKRVDTKAAHLVVAGNSGTMQHLDYRGVEVLSSYEPVTIRGLNWAILAEMDMSEIMGPASILQRQIVLLSLLAAIVGYITISLLLKRIVLNPIEALSSVVGEVRKGNYADRVPVSSSDEFGDLALTLNAMAASIEQQKDESQETQERLEAILESAPDGMIVIDESGTIRIMNRQVESLFGYTREELIGQTIERLLPEALRAHHPTHRAEYFKNPRTRQLGEERELEAQRKDGTRFPVGVGLSHFYEGGEIRVSAAVRDHTDRARKQRLAVLNSMIGNALTENVTIRDTLQACTEAIVRQMRGALVRIWVFNEKEAVLELQASAGLYTHIDGSRHRVPLESNKKVGVIARERKTLYSYDIADDPLIDDREWARDHGLHGFVGIPLVVDKRLVGVIVFFSTHHLDDDLIASLESVADSIGIAVDRKQAEEVLRISQHTIEQAGDGILWVRIDDATFVNANRTACEMSGYSTEELLKMPIFKLDTGVTQEAWPSLCQQVKENKTLHLESVHRAKDGREYPVEVTVTCVEYEGKESLIAFVRNITERKRMEEELRRATVETDSANEAKSDFLASMSHEIRTPMNAIIDMTHLCRQTDLTAKQEDYLAKVDNASRSLLGIVNDILDFPKIEAGSANKGRKTEIYSSEMEGTSKALDVVLNSVRELQEYPEPKPNRESQRDEIDIDEVRAILHDLATFLEDDDTKAAVYVERLKPQLTRFGVEEKLERLDELVGSDDFEEAMRCLSEIAHSLGITIEGHDNA